jgi:cyclase
MLKKRIIVTLSHDGKGMAVKTKKFQHPARQVGSLMHLVEVLAERDIDELILSDIHVIREKRAMDFKCIERYAQRLYCPLTIGGGIRTTDDIR